MDADLGSFSAERNLSSRFYGGGETNIINSTSTGSFRHTILVNVHFVTTICQLQIDKEILGKVSSIKSLLAPLHGCCFWNAAFQVFFQAKKPAREKMSSAFFTPDSCHARCRRATSGLGWHRPSGSSGRCPPWRPRKRRRGRK